MYDSIIFTDVTDNMNAGKAIGAYKCAKSLRDAGHSCLVIDRLHRFSIEELDQLFKIAVNPNTKFVGFSTTFFANTNVSKNKDGSTPPYGIMGNSFMPWGKEFENQFMELIRSYCPSIKIVVGGANIRLFEKNRNINYLFVGYSESGIVNLMDHLTNGATLNKSMKNLWGVTVVDDRASEDYDFVNNTMTWLDTDIVNQLLLPFEVARGCIFQCKFCSFPMNGKQNLDFIKTDTALKYELERNFKEFGIYKYQIIDDTFNDNDPKIDRILRLVESLDFQPEFWAYLRLDLLSRNYKSRFKKLYDIGLRSVSFGIETMHPEAAKIIGKGYDRERQIETLHYIRNEHDDFFMSSGFIVGLPEESIEQVTQTSDQLLSGEIPLHSWMFYPLTLQPQNRVIWKSEFELNYKEYGYTYTDVVHEYPLGIEWFSKHMSFTDAIALANDFNAQQRAFSGLVTQRAWGYYGALGLDQKHLVSTPFNKIDFNYIENLINLKDKNYKKQLFDLLSKKF